MSSDNTALYTQFSSDGLARRGRLNTDHGTVETPAFMPVGTSSAVKALTMEDLEHAGAEMILGNTYHLYLRPGHELIRRLGGLAAFNGWKKPTLTDSGGFQIFSLRDLSVLDDNGVEFKSHLDGSKHRFTPEKVMEIEQAIGADIIMVLDQCAPYPCSHEEAATAVTRTTAWAKRAKSYLAEHPEDSKWRQFLFGIVQGSVNAELRVQSAKDLVDLDFPGYAVGGLSVGEPKPLMEEMLAATMPHLPTDRPRYLMGVGYPEDILMAVSYGIDMFDCVLPTRNARTGAVFTSRGPLVYRNAEYADDPRPLDEACNCPCCKRYSRAYLRHLYNQSEITAMVLSSVHNTFFFQHLMQGIRKAIEEKRFDAFRKSFLSVYQQGQIR
jgi:queuine tRNA-ribosyltransferase